MTRQELIDRHKHKLFGVMLDAIVRGRTGEFLSKFAESTLDMIEAEIGKIYDELQPPVPKVDAQANGKHLAAVPTNPRGQR